VLVNGPLVSNAFLLDFLVTAEALFGYGKRATHFTAARTCGISSRRVH
jgi:hypothetical protein